MAIPSRGLLALGRSANSGEKFASLWLRLAEKGKDIKVPRASLNSWAARRALQGITRA